MATNLNKTDVVIVGLGAVGGAAALPLAQAGLEVIGGCDRAIPNLRVRWRRLVSRR
jgi:glycine/D-amino acid oxidase-like deaminating enzyme